MISIRPIDFRISTCPLCRADEIENVELFFQGIHILMDAKCLACGLDFWQTLPIAHDFYSPIALKKSDLTNLLFDPSNQWRAKPLAESFRTANHHQVKISKVVHKNSFIQAVLLNCLDNCFGHVFIKLWNVQTLLKNHPDKHIIVLAPALADWMIPAGVGEKWLIQYNLTQGASLLAGLDDFIKKEISRFEKVGLSQVPIHLDHHKHIDLEALVGKKRFKLEDFTTLPPQITFALREDRFWLGSLVIGKLYLASIKFGLLNPLRFLFLWRQRYLVKQVRKLISKEFPLVSIYLTGIGNSLSYGDGFRDLRVTKPTYETESKWNEIYAGSHVVIGVHGSNMLIPTALSAGFINLIPRYKIDHLVEDTVLPYSNRMLQFMGRFLDETTSPRLLVSHLGSIFRKFPYVFESTRQIPE